MESKFSGWDRMSFMTWQSSDLLWGCRGKTRQWRCWLCLHLWRAPSFGTHPRHLYEWGGESWGTILTHLSVPIWYPDLSCLYILTKPSTLNDSNTTHRRIMQCLNENAPNDSWEKLREKNITAFMYLIRSPDPPCIWIVHFAPSYSKYYYKFTPF